MIELSLQRLFSFWLTLIDIIDLSLSDQTVAKWIDPKSAYLELLSGNLKLVHLHQTLHFWDLSTAYE